MPAFLVIVMALAVGCTGGDEQPKGSPTTPSGAPVASNVVVTFRPGQYRYSFNNITATLVMDGSSATMDVKNGSGAEVGAPTIYVINDKGVRVDAKVANGAPVPDGGDATFAVTFPDSITSQNAGLIVLSLGGENYGAFAPVPQAGASPSA